MPRNLFDRPTGLGACPLCGPGGCKTKPYLGQLIPKPGATARKEAEQAMQQPTENKAIGLTPRREDVETKDLPPAPESEDDDPQDAA